MTKSTPSDQNLVVLASELDEARQGWTAMLHNAIHGYDGAVEHHDDATRDAMAHEAGLSIAVRAFARFEAVWDPDLWKHLGKPSPGVSSENAERARTVFERLTAWHHVRQIGAHGVDGSRTDRDGKPLRTGRDEFDLVMASGDRLGGVTLVDPERIRVSTALFADLYNSMHKACMEGLVRYS